MKDSTKRKIRFLSVLLFILYVLLLVYFLFFSEEYGRVTAEERVYRYNLVPFVEIRRFWIYRKQLGMFALITNLFGNVIGFIPYGFILPVIAHKCRNGLFIVASGFSLSLLVETVQLIAKVGCFDVDDLILNTLGAAIGYMLFAVCNYLRRKVGLAIASLLLFGGAVGIAYVLEGSYGFIVGGICLFAALLSVYGFLMGISSFSEEKCTHRTSIIGSILNGIFMVGWLAFFLMGV